MFRIKKVLNVNVVLAEQDGHEYIAFGKGIGYRQKVNACLPDNQRDLQKIHAAG